MVVTKKMTKKIMNKILSWLGDDLNSSKPIPTL